MSIFGALLGAVGSLMGGGGGGQGQAAAAQVQAQKLASATNRLNQATQSKTQLDVAQQQGIQNQAAMQQGALDNVVDVLRQSLLKNMNLPR